MRRSLVPLELLLAPSDFQAYLCRLDGDSGQDGLGDFRRAQGPQLTRATRATVHGWPEQSKEGCRKFPCAELFVRRAFDGVPVQVQVVDEINRSMRQVACYGVGFPLGDAGC